MTRKTCHWCQDISDVYWTNAPLMSSSSTSLWFGSMAPKVL